MSSDVLSKFTLTEWVVSALIFALGVAGFLSSVGFGLWFFARHVDNPQPQDDPSISDDDEPVPALAGVKPGDWIRVSVRVLNIFRSENQMFMYPLRAMSASSIR